MLRKDELPDYFPPFYQPQGASHYGGSFADVVCVCNVPGVTCKCKQVGSEMKDVEAGEKVAASKMPADAVDVKMGGCGVPGV